MTEPYLSQFRELLRRGAGTADVQDPSIHVGFAEPIAGQEIWIDREVDRVALHRRNLCRILEEFVPRADRILDVGCSTGATTVAMALSDRLKPTEVLGLDPNRASLEAAHIRALGHELPPERISFRYLEPNCLLPLESDSFSLTVCVSVIEYVHDPALRRQLVKELLRVTKPGGFVYLSTPNPLRLREYHTGRIFGNQITKEGFPWANTPWELRGMFAGCELISLERYYGGRMAERSGLPIWGGILGRLVLWLAPWQKILARKRLDS